MRERSAVAGAASRPLPPSPCGSCHDASAADVTAQTASNDCSVSAVRQHATFCCAAGLKVTGSAISMERVSLFQAAGDC
jgi:hypothetical protein